MIQVWGGQRPSLKSQVAMYLEALTKQEGLFSPPCAHLLALTFRDRLESDHSLGLDFQQSRR